MKVYFSYAILIIVIICSHADCKSQALPTRDSIEITDILFSQQEAWNNGNLKLYMNAYWKSDSLRFITKKGVTYGWYSTMDKYKNAYPDKASMGILKFGVLSLEYLSETKVLLTGTWELEAKGTVIKGIFTLIWKRMNGKWVIILDHTS
jgi:hypothetical protein